MNETLGSSDGVEYAVFDMSVFDEVAIVVAEAFIRYEPMGVIQQLSLDDFVAFLKVLGPKMAQEALSIVARDQETGKIIGALIADDFASPPPQGMSNLSEKFAPIFALLDELDAQYKNGKIIHVGDILHLFMLAVTFSATGKKVAQNLNRVCLVNGISRGYKTAVLEATNVTSQAVARKSGFVDRFEIPYKTFMFQGKTVFSSIEGQTSIILMDKVLNTD